MLADFLHALNIFSESGINDVGVDLGVGTVLDTSLSVKEPLGDGVIYECENKKLALQNKMGMFAGHLPVGLAKISLTLLISSSVRSPALLFTSI